MIARLIEKFSARIVPGVGKLSN